MERIYFVDEMTPLLEHSYTTKDGEQRWENRVTITNIAPFGPRRKAEGGQTS